MRTSLSSLFVSAILCCGFFSPVFSACQVCHAGTLAFRPFNNPNGGLTFAALHRVVQQQPAVAAASLIVARQVAVRHWNRKLLSQSKEKAENEADGDDTSDAAKDKNRGNDKDVTSALMVGTIGFYKRFISPLLPPACRFVPTCSQYGVQAIEEFGPAKGCVLIAWRLLRCSPIGGKGYDPPKWPPVPFTYSSY